MSLSMSQASLPVFLRALTNLRGVLQKGEAFAADKGIEPSVLLNSRLIADMFPLTKQVQIATDMAVRGSARLAGTEPPPVGQPPKPPTQREPMKSSLPSATPASRRIA